MEISTTIWKIMMNIEKHLLPILIITILVLLERYFIKIKSKGKIILPAAAVIFAFLFSFVQFGFVNFNPPESLKTQIEYDSHSDVTSHLTVLHTEKGNIIAIGQLITEEGTNSRFIDLSVKNGEVTSTSEPVDTMVIENIELNLSSLNKDYSGSSVPYGELLEMEEKYKSQQPYQIDFITFLYRFFYILILVAILLIMYGIDRKRGGGSKVC